jgi:anti-sigma B factor antagonist
MDGALVTIELNGGGVAALRGELDMSSYDDASAALAPLFDEDGDVVLDLAELTFVDSSGIRIFIRLHTAVHERGGRLILRGPTANVARVFAVAGLPQMGIVIDEVPS